MEKILTISVAGYNIEKFVDTTLGSFVIPEIMDDLEVILVNDGSKDKTSDLGHNFADKYPDTFVVIDKENGGYGSTINASIKVAGGKYFKTVDGDDWVDREGFVNLVRYLKNANDDVVVTNFSRVNDKSGEIIPAVFSCSAYNKSLNFDEEYHDQLLFMQALTIKTSVLRNADINITQHCFYTDIEYILSPAKWFNTVSFLNENVYMYRTAVNEQSMSIAGKKKHIDEQLKIYKKMTEYYRSVNNTIGKGKQRFFITILSEMYKSHITAILSLNINKASKRRLIDIEEYTKNTIPDIYKETYKYRTISILRNTGYVTYSCGSVLYKIYQKILADCGRS